MRKQVKPKRPARKRKINYKALFENKDALVKLDTVIIKNLNIKLLAAEADQRRMLDVNLKLSEHIRDYCLMLDALCRALETAEQRVLFLDQLRENWREQARRSATCADEYMAKRDGLASRNQELEAQLQQMLQTAQEPIRTVMQMEVEKW